MEVTKNGDFITWIVVITNNGGATNTNVKFQDNLAAGLAYQSYTIGPPVKGTFNMSNGLWTIGNQASGVSYQIAIKYKVIDITQATQESGVFGFLLSGLVSGDNLDPNDIDNNITDFVEITTCAPSAGAENDLNSCLCGSVADNDTACTHGETEWRLEIGTLVNLDPSFTLDPVTGAYNAMGKILNRYEGASFQYSIWCTPQGGSALQTSGPATVTFPPEFPVEFTDKLEILTGVDLGYAKHTALDGTEVTFKLGWVIVTEDSGTGDLIFTYPNGTTTVVNLGSITMPGYTVYPTVVNANIVLSAATLRNFTKVNDSGGANINITLPDPATLSLGTNKTYEWTFKRINLYDTGSIALTPGNFKTIDGDASYAFSPNDYTSVTIFTDGVNWFLK